MLRIAARRIRKSLRAGDFAAHLGQDDFVVVATELDERQRRGDDRRPVQAALSQAVLDPRRGAAVSCTRRGDAARRTTGRSRSGCSPTPRSRSPRRRRPGRAACAISARICGSRSSGARRCSPSCCTGSTPARSCRTSSRRLDLATGGFAGFEALARWQHPGARPAGAGGLPRLRRADRPHRADRRAGADPHARGAARLGRGRARRCRGSGSTSRSAELCEPAADRADQVGDRALRHRAAAGSRSRCWRRC